MVPAGGLWNQLAGAHFLRFQDFASPPFQTVWPWKEGYSSLGNCPTLQIRAIFSEACLLLCHWFPPSQPSLQGNTVAAALTSGSSFSLSLQPQTQARPRSLLECSWGLPAWSGPPCPSAASFWANTPAFRWWGGGLFSLVLQAPFGQMAGGGSLLFGAVGPLWSVGGEGALLFGAAGPLWSVGGEGSLLFGAAGPLWSDGGEGALLFGAAGPLWSPHWGALTGTLCPFTGSSLASSSTSRCPDFMPFPS